MQCSGEKRIKYKRREEERRGEERWQPNFSGEEWGKRSEETKRNETRR